MFAPITVFFDHRGHMRSPLKFGAIPLSLALAACATAPPILSNPTATPAGPYSQLAEAGGFVFVSGIIAIDPTTRQLSAPNIQDQSRQALANLDALLAAQGLSRNDIVKTTVFLRDPADMSAMNTAYAEFFGDHRPARTTVPGADWGTPNILIEIEAIAYRR